MNYAELRRRLIEAGFDTRYVLHWAQADEERHLRQVAYNVVWRGEEFVLISSDGRAGFYQRMGPAPTREPLEFDTEAEVCDYIWWDLTRPKPPAYKSTKTSEQLAEQRRRAKENYELRVAERNSQSGIES